MDATPGDGLCETATGNGLCTLRAAIQEANAREGADSIQVPEGTYALAIPGRAEDAAAAGDLDITDDVTVAGIGAEATIVDGDDIDRIFDVAPPVAGFTPAIDVTISGLTVADGLASFAGPTDAGEGGGIRYASTLTVSAAAIVDSAGTFGGGIASSIAGRGENARLTLKDSEVARNTGAPGGPSFPGGGIEASGLSLTIIRSRITDNLSERSGAGISATGLVEPVVLTEVTVSGNHTGRQGGGISASGLVLTRSTISGNRGAGNGGGLSLVGTNTISNSTISDNQAVFSRPGPPLAGNGGGIAIRGQLTLTHVTITGNSADVAMGGTGGGLSVSSGTATLVSSIVASSTGADCAALSSGGGAVQSGGNNIDGDGSCGLTEPGDLPGTDPTLAPLADNGGPTLTHALLPGSPALDAGRDAGVSVDQRGVPRPQGTGFDIGAFELDAAPEPPEALCFGVPPTDPGSLTGTPGNDVIIGSESNDAIESGAGHDLVCGGGGDDVIASGLGDDRLDGGLGGDRLSGGAGTDVLRGADGEDAIFGGRGDDELLGEGSDDVLRGGPGNDRLDGGEGTDFCRGGAGADSASACEA